MKSHFIANVRKKLSRLSRKQLIISVAAGLVVVTIGIVSVLSMASGFFASSDPENGTLTANAKVVTDSSASGGKAIQFTAPAGGGGTGGGGGGSTGTCANSTPHVPDGSD